MISANDSEGVWKQRKIEGDDRKCIQGTLYIWIFTLGSHLQDHSVEYVEKFGRIRALHSALLCFYNVRMEMSIAVHLKIWQSSMGEMLMRLEVTTSM